MSGRFEQHLLATYSIGLAKSAQCAYNSHMNRPDPQLNIRSAYARQRAAALSQATGMTATQVVEEALRAYTPPVATAPGGLERRGPLLVRPGGDTVSLAAANAAVDAARSDR